MINRTTVVSDEVERSLFKAVEAQYRVSMFAGRKELYLQIPNI